MVNSAINRMTKPPALQDTEECSRFIYEGNIIVVTTPPLRVEFIASPWRTQTSKASIDFLFHSDDGHPTTVHDAMIHLSGNSMSVPVFTSISLGKALTLAGKVTAAINQIIEKEPCRDDLIYQKLLNELQAASCIGITPTQAKDIRGCENPSVFEKVLEQVRPSQSDLNPFALDAV